ncbi:hypothetical protein [Acinetobacter sp. ANC 3832]|uniref:hypothetical protein n=1 Tax=Acinetobacter sp. ANC 3832 TaxID=1977874 RepID=UPI000A353BBD|nr:hypothetical protein [Acinetobacter sp. ANC 3832]
MEFKQAMMKNKLVFVLIGLMSTFSNANSTGKLTQVEYNQLIQQYTNQVNETKKILDEPEAHSNATMQKQAFCSRIEAYEHIAHLSKENTELETANIMFTIAHNFLERQKQSFIDSGMTAQVFCAAVKKEK